MIWHIIAVWHDKASTFRGLPRAVPQICHMRGMRQEGQGYGNEYNSGLRSVIWPANGVGDLKWPEHGQCSGQSLAGSLRYEEMTPVTELYVWKQRHTDEDMWTFYGTLSVCFCLGFSVLASAAPKPHSSGPPSNIAVLNSRKKPLKNVLPTLFNSLMQ